MGLQKVEHDLVTEQQNPEHVKDSQTSTIRKPNFKIWQKIYIETSWKIYTDGK